MSTDSELTPYTLTEGGIEGRVDTWLHVRKNDGKAWLRRAAAFLLVAYVVPIALAAIGRVVTGQWSPAVLQVDTHVRLLLAAPLLIFAEQLVNERAIGAGKYLLRAEIIAGAEIEKYRNLIVHTARLRDSAIAETLLLATAGVTTLLDLTSVLLVPKPLQLWGALLALTFFRFLLLRWLWRWALWALLLLRISRLNLALSSTHADRAGGLAVLMGPSEAFGAVALAGACALVGSWLEQIRHGARVDDFVPAAVTYACLIVVIAAAPLLTFTPKLYAVRRQGLAEYGAFLRRYCAAFDAKWLPLSGEAALGAEDISGLADAGTSYEVPAEMRVVLVSRRLVTSLVVACLIPMAPLLFIRFSAPQLLMELARALV